MTGGTQMRRGRADRDAAGPGRPGRGEPDRGADLALPIWDSVAAAGRYARVSNGLSGQPVRAPYVLGQSAAEKSSNPAGTVVGFPPPMISRTTSTLRSTVSG